MGFESHEYSQAEQDASYKQRTLSDAELIKGGAEFEGGKLEATQGQKDDAHREMRRAKGEYSPEERKKIEEAINAVVEETSVKPSFFSEFRDEFHRKRSVPQTRPTLNNYRLVALTEFRQINPSQFDKEYRSRFDWGAIKDALEEDEKDYSYSTATDFTREISALKELFPDKISEIAIDDKLWRRMVQQAEDLLHPGKYALDLLGNRFQNGIQMAADLRFFDSARLGDNLQITLGEIEKLRKIVATEEARGQSDERMKRALRFFTADQSTI